MTEQLDLFAEQDNRPPRPPNIPMPPVPPRPSADKSLALPAFLDRSNRRYWNADGTPVKHD